MLHLDLLYHLLHQTVGELLCDGTHSVHALFPLLQHPHLITLNSFKQEKEEEECSFHHISMWSEWTSVLLSVSEPPGHHAPPTVPLQRPGFTSSFKQGEKDQFADQTSPNDIFLGWQIPGINVSQQMTTLAESCLKVSSKQYTIHRGVLVPSGSRLQKGKGNLPNSIS